MNYQKEAQGRGVMYTGGRGDYLLYHFPKRVYTKDTDGQKQLKKKIVLIRKVKEVTNRG